jgi:hypothetical protein
LLVLQESLVGTPADAAQARTCGHDGPVEDRARLLTAAVTVSAVETVGLLAALLAKGGRGFLLAPWLALKLGFCWGALRRGPGSFLALLLYEGAALLFALVATGVAAWARALVVVVAAAVLALLAASARLFPSPVLPRP